MYTLLITILLATLVSEGGISVHSISIPNIQSLSECRRAGSDHISSYNRRIYEIGEIRANYTCIETGN